MNKFFLYLFALMTITSTSLAAPLMCEDIFFESPIVLEKTSLQLFKLENDLADLGQALEAGRLTWDSFAALDKTQKQVSNYVSYLSKVSPEQRAFEKRKMLKSIDNHPSIKVVFDYLERQTPELYAPTEYDLQRAFLKKAITIIKTLPEDFRPKVNRIARDTRLAEINKTSQEITKAQLKIFDNIFQRSGFKSYKEFEQHLRESQSPLIKKALEIIDSDGIEFAIRRPENGRFWISKVGFQNQYITNSSNGALNHNARYKLESSMLQKKYDEYVALDSEIKPKYGTFDIKREQNITSNISGSSPYGSDIFYLKKDMIENRVTFFPGDSLNHHNVNSMYKEIDTFKNPSIQSYFIPWERKLLMVPFMLNKLEHSEFSTPNFNPQIAETHNIKLRGWDSIDKMAFSHKYWEFQIFGRLDLSMVGKFKFTATPPSGEFLAALRKHKIEIIDGRDDRHTAWNGEN